MRCSNKFFHLTTDFVGASPYGRSLWGSLTEEKPTGSLTEEKPLGYKKRNSNFFEFLLFIFLT
jgi:hypothetical protein